MNDVGKYALLISMDGAGPAAPLQTRIADRLADLLWISDEIMEMIAASSTGYEFTDCNRDVRAIYDTASALMKTMCD
jgi:hypothetical protein